MLSSVRTFFSTNHTPSVISDETARELKVATDEITHHAKLEGLNLSIDVLQTIKDNFSVIEKVYYYGFPALFKTAKWGMGLFAGSTLYDTYREYDPNNYGKNAPHYVINFLYLALTYVFFKADQMLGDPPRRVENFMDRGVVFNCIMATAMSVDIQRPTMLSVGELLEKLKEKRQEMVQQELELQPLLSPV